jgi:elongation factor G
MGELHLEILKDRMLREFKVQANAGKPVVAYRETVARPRRARTPLTAKSAGKHFGTVVLEVAPRARGAGKYDFHQASEKQIPSAFHEFVEAGIRTDWSPAWWPTIRLIDVAVRVVSGSSIRWIPRRGLPHRGQHGLREAARAARPTLLEPIMKGRGGAPDEHLGDVIGDVNARRGRILDGRRGRRGYR